MPRARNCDSTMRSCRREKAAVSPEEFMGKNLFQTILFLALSNADIKADYAVLIARAHHRNITIHVVFALNDLLRTLRDVGAVGERKVIGELLFDGDLRASRCGIGFRSQPLRIDLDAADSKELLHAAADRGVNRLIDDQVRGFIGKDTLARLLL